MTEAYGFVIEYIPVMVQMNRRVHTLLGFGGLPSDTTLTAVYPWFIVLPTNISPSVCSSSNYLTFNLSTDFLICVFLILFAGRERATVPVRGRAVRRTCDLLTSGSIMRRWRWRTWRKLPALPRPDMIRPSSPARTSPRLHTANQRARWAARAATQVKDV